MSESLLTFAVVLVAVLLFAIWAVRRSRTKEPTFDLDELRRDLTTSTSASPEMYDEYVKPILEQLEAQYGKRVPLHEIVKFQQLCTTKMAEIEVQRQAIIDRGAKQGATISIEALRAGLNKDKEAYDGPDKEAYARELDKLVEILITNYGTAIPVDEAYEIQKHLDSVTRCDTKTEL